MNTFISADNTLAIWAVILGFVFFAMYAERHWKWASLLGACLICLVGGMFLSTIRLVPTEAAAYDVIWAYVTPAAIPLVLLNADLRRIGRESGKMLFIFLFSCAGTMLGAFLASAIFRNMIPEVSKVAGIFTASQTGGSMNVVAMREITQISGGMYYSVYIADILTFTFTLFALTMLPSIKFLRKHYGALYPIPDGTRTMSESSEETKTSIYELGTGLALSFVIVALSVLIAGFVKGANAPAVIRVLFGEKYLVITAISVLIATLFPKQMSKIKGAQELGIYMMFTFFVAVSIEADLLQIAATGPALIAFSFVVFAGIVGIALLFGKLFKFKIEEISIAANAALGGPTTAAAAAAAKGWSELVTPAVLLGTLGYVVGNYLGTAMMYAVQSIFGV